MGWSLGLGGPSSTTPTCLILLICKETSWIEWPPSFLLGFLIRSQYQLIHRDLGNGQQFTFSLGNKEPMISVNKQHKAYSTDLLHSSIHLLISYYKLSNSLNSVVANGKCSYNLLQEKSRQNQY